MPWSCFAYIRQVRESDLRPTERLVLTMIAHRADKDTGIWYGGIRVICEDTGLARSTVVTTVDRLAKTPLLDVEKRHGRTHVYRSTYETTPVQPSDGLPVRPPDPSDCRQVRPPDQGGPTTGPVPVRPLDQGGPTTGPNPPTYPPNDPPRAAEGATASAQGSDERIPAGPICEGCDSAAVASLGELCPACVEAERDRSPGHQAGEPPSDPDVAKIAERIRGHAIFARLNADHIAETHAHHCSTGGKRLSWVLAAIDECADAANAAAAAPGESWAEGYKADRISRYIRRAKAPKKAEWVDNPDGPSVPSDPRFRKRYKLPEVKNPVGPAEIRAFLKTARLGDRLVVAPDPDAQQRRAKAAAAGSEKS